MSDYERQREEIFRRQALMDAMAQQQQPTGQMAGRIYVPNIAGNIGRIANAWMAGRQRPETDQQLKDLETSRQADLMKQLEAFDTTEDKQAVLRQAMVSAHPEMRRLGELMLQQKAVKPGERWEVLNQERKQQLGLPLDDAYQMEVNTGAVKKLDNAPKISTAVNLPSAERTLDIELSKNIAEEVKETRASASKAAQTLDVADRLKALDAQGVFSGPTANFATTLAALAQGAGMNLPKETIEKMARSEEAQQQVATKVAEVLMDSSLGRTFTDQDRKEFMKSLPNLLSSPEGRARIISDMERAAQRDLQHWEALRKSLETDTIDRKTLLNTPIRGRKAPPPSQPMQGEQVIDGVIVTDWGQ